MTQGKTIRILKNPFLFRFFLLTSLPAAFFAGIRLPELNSEKAVATVRFSWFSKNPFRSIYFACLAMAAEMSTGLLALIHSRHIKPTVSMLVLEMQSTFHKKATGRIQFVCMDGKKIEEAIHDAVSSGEAITCTAISKGYNEEGICVATFNITWTFKQRKN